MEKTDYQKIIDHILKEEKLENLLPKFAEAEKACYNGDELGLANLVDFSTGIVWEYCAQKEIDSVVGIYERVRDAIEYSKNNKQVSFWREAVVKIYPQLAYAYMEQSEWGKADSTVKQYVDYLDDFYNAPDILEGERYKQFEFDNLFKTVERLSKYYERIDEIHRAVSCLSSISRFVNYDDEKLQFEYYASLATLYHKAFHYSFNKAKENIDCLISESPVGLFDELHNK